jgi:hypothetical protein
MLSTRWPRGTDRSASSALRWAGGCLATAALLSIAGCVPSTAEPAVTPTATASAAAPVFASDEEALAAATAAFTEYTGATEAILYAAGEEPERIHPFVTEAHFPTAVKNFEWFADNQIRFEGALAFDHITLQSADYRTDGSAQVFVYLCSDVSATRLIGANGADVTPPDRQDRLPLLVEFSSDSSEAGLLQVNDSSLWTGENFCST